MTDTHETVRLAEWLENDIPPHDRGQLLQAAALLRRIPDLEAVIDELAQFIRWADGSHKTGAGVLAERIVEWLTASSNADQKGQ